MTVTPSKKPAELRRAWNIAACDTDKGTLGVAAEETGLSLPPPRP